MSNFFSTAYIPPLSMWEALFEEDEICLCAEEIYEKQTFRNRAFILTSQGEHRLTVPVTCSQGPLTLVKEVKICYNKDWRKDHWRSLCTAYNNSPYFLYYKDDLEAIFGQKFEYLWDLNLEILKYLMRAFKWDKPIREVNGKPEAWENTPVRSYENTFLWDVVPERKGQISVCDYLYNQGGYYGR